MQHLAQVRRTISSALLHAGGWGGLLVVAMVVAVNDTIEKRLMVLGPMMLMYGVAPRIRPCPI